MKCTRPTFVGKYQQTSPSSKQKQTKPVFWRNISTPTNFAHIRFKPHPVTVALFKLGITEPKNLVIPWNRGWVGIHWARPPRYSEVPPEWRHFSNQKIIKNPKLNELNWHPWQPGRGPHPSNTYILPKPTTYQLPSDLSGSVRRWPPHNKHRWAAADGPPEAPEGAQRPNGIDQRHPVKVEFISFYPFNDVRFQKIQNKSSSWGSCNYHSQISGWHPPHISYTSIPSFQHQKVSSCSCTFTCKMLSSTEVMDGHFPCIFIIITWVFWSSWMGPGIKFWNPYRDERNSHIQNSLGRQFSALVFEAAWI